MIQIIGKGGLAREVALYVKGKKFFFENEEIKDALPSILSIIAIGNGTIREKIVKENPNLIWGIVDVGHTYGEARVGIGSIICPGTILTTNITIGNHVLLNLNCTVGHDVVIDDYTTASPGVNISGNVTIGKRCYLGTNCVIRENIDICDDVIIGAGGVVVKDITEPGTYVGNPVKKLEKPPKTPVKENFNPDWKGDPNDELRWKGW